MKTDDDRAREWVARIWEDPRDELVAIRKLIAEVRCDTMEAAAQLAEGVMSPFDSGDYIAERLREIAKQSAEVQGPSTERDD